MFNRLACPAWSISQALGGPPDGPAARSAISLAQVDKEGSSVFGRLAWVTDPDWHGMVKVVLEGDPPSRVRSYRHLDIEYVAPSEAEVKAAEARRARRRDGREKLLAK